MTIERGDLARSGGQSFSVRRFTVQNLCVFACVCMHPVPGRCNVGLKKQRRVGDEGRSVGPEPKVERTGPGPRRRKLQGPADPEGTVDGSRQTSNIWGSWRERLNLDAGLFRSGPAAAMGTGGGVPSLIGTGPRLGARLVPKRPERCGATSIDALHSSRDMTGHTRSGQEQRAESKRADHHDGRMPHPPESAEADRENE